MKRWKLALAVLSLSALSAFAAACGDDDSNGNHPNDGGSNDGSPNPQNDGGGSDSPSDGPPGTNTFPKYVEQLISKETNETAAGKPVTEWESLADDEKYTVPPGFF